MRATRHRRRLFPPAAPAPPLTPPHPVPLHPLPSVPFPYFGDFSPHPPLPLQSNSQSRLPIDVLFFLFLVSASFPDRRRRRRFCLVLGSEVGSRRAAQPAWESRKVNSDVGRLQWTPQNHALQNRPPSWRRFVRRWRCTNKGAV